MGHPPRIECHGFTSHGTTDDLTLSSLVQAGVEIVELDIQVTADGEVIEFHDFQTPSGQWVCDSPASALTRLGPADGGLTRRVQRLEAAGFTVNLDLKVFSGFQSENIVVDALMRFLEATAPSFSGHLSSWDQDLLARLKQRHPSLTTRAAVKGRPYRIDRIGEGVDGMNLPWDGSTLDDVAAIQRVNSFVAFYGGWGDRYRPLAEEWGVDVVSVDLREVVTDAG